jgi:hypothetical protein
MHRGAPEDLEYQTRYWQMNAQFSIQDLYDLLVELITNCDDSYHRLFEDKRINQDGGTILVEVERHRGKGSSGITVSDRGEGLRDMRNTIKRVGGRTSGAGDRGFMARGLKDCAALGYVTVESIRDGLIEKGEVTTAFKFIPYEPASRKGDQATEQDRKRLGIPKGNGTVVHVELERRVAVPLQAKLLTELPWHYALRDIARLGGPSKLLVRAPGEKPQPVQYVAPEAERVHDEEFQVPGYPHRARLTVFRAAEPLEDPPDKRFRRSGILIQGQRGIHACSFLTSELERDPAAERYFGRLSCDGIDLLAEAWDEARGSGVMHPPDNPILVLDPNRRAGLAENHPFTKALFDTPTQVLRAQFEKDRAETKRSRREIEAKETTERLRRLAREASKFMREQLEDLGSVGVTDTVSSKSYAEKGVAIVPAFTQVRIGDEKRFTVRVSPDLQLPLGTVVKPFLSKPAENCLELVGDAEDLEADPTHEGALRGSFTVRAKSEARRVQIGSQVDGLDPVFAEIQVMPAEPIDVDIPGDLAFHRKVYSVRQGSRRTLYLKARFNPPPVGIPAATLKFTNASVAVVRSQTPLALVAGTTYYEAAFKVEGKKLHGKTEVIAEVDGRKATCELHVVARESEGAELEFKLVEHSLGHNYRAVWDRKQPTRLLITTQHESIRRYLGREEDGYPGQHGPAFRVLLAELISDNVCRRIVEEHARALPHEFDSDKVYVLHNRLMKDFTPIAHRIQLAESDIPLA